MSGDESSGAEERALQIDVGKVEAKKGRTPGEKEETVWKAGDTVWAKVSGFSYWPAKVFDPKDDLIPEWLQDPPKPNYILVRFFATYDIEWVSPRAIETYEKGLKKKFHIKSRSKVFQKAVQEVKECLATGVVPEGLTSPPPEPQGEDSKAGSPPRKAAVGSKRKSPSSAKQRSPATKRSRKGSDTGKEGEPEPPMSPDEVKEDGSPPRKAAVGSKRKSPSRSKQRSPATKRSQKGSDTGKEGEPEPPMSPDEAGSPPRKAAVGSKRKSPSRSKQRSPATKRSQKGSDTGEGEPEPPISPDKIKEAGGKRCDKVIKKVGLGSEAAEDTKNQETSS